MVVAATSTFKDATATGRLSGYAVLEVEGKDAAAFLQAQSMNDVADLTAGSWQWNGLLSPRGRLLALFALLRLEEDRFWLLSPDLPAPALDSLLRTYVFRRKLVLRPRSGLAAFAFRDPPADAATAVGDRFAIDATSAIWLDFGGQGGPRWLHVAAAGGAETDAQADAAWRAADLRHGLPRLPPEQTDRWTVHMLSLQRLAAFSLRKGCYPGQEIVARTHYRGEAKRRLVGVGGEGLVAGQLLRTGGRDWAELVCTSTDGGFGLAVAGADDPVAMIEAPGGPVAMAELLGGLQRLPDRAPAEQ